jgi:diguanylate cyclase (GGDEF)-like protein/PAS domain S-box-containing protein
MLAVLVIATAAACTGGYWLWRSAARARVTAADAVERRYNVLEAVGHGIYIIDENIRITHVNEAAEDMLRLTADVLVGTPLERIVDPLASELVPDIRYARRTGNVVERTCSFAATETWVEVRIRPAATETLVSLRDVTLRTRAELRLRENEQRLRLMTHNVDAVLWTTDREARFMSISGGALADLGLRADGLVDQPCGALIAERVLDEVFEGQPVRAETTRGERWLRHHVEPLRGPSGDIIGAVGVSIDITELKRAQQQLFESAHRDRLTGLPNRLSLETRLAETLADAARDDLRRFALLFVDLDRFKTINDTLGHSVGDDVLREVALRLQEALRGGDVIARPGGDEFMILVPRIAPGADVQILAQRLVASLAQPVVVRGRELYVSASVGAAVYPDHGRDQEALVAHADTAMYRAKHLGGNRWTVFDDSMLIEATERLTLENDLRQALYRDELRLLYQPIVDVLTGAVLGCEALVRWHHVERGVVSPTVFIPIAEETGAIVALDRWVLREACGTAAQMRTLIPDFRIAVNLSPRDLRETDFPDVVAAVLAEHDLPSRALVVEVTESVATDDTVLPVLERLCALGVGVAVDDFGIGYSSLSYLKRLPVTALKIDRAFIRDVADDAYDQAIVGSIVTVAKALGLQITAEGLETAEQVAFVASLGCEEGQGFRFAAPLSYERLRDAVAASAVSGSLMPSSSA